jgi:putative transposase
MPYWRLHYHLVRSARERLPLIGDVEELAIRRSFELTVSDLDLIPHAVGVMPDHAHVAVSIPPKLAVAEVVRRLKGPSANAVNIRSGEPRSESFRWQGDYGALSFGDNALERVAEYVAHQAERHARADFGQSWNRPMTDTKQSAPNVPDRQTIRRNEPSSSP